MAKKVKPRFRQSRLRPTYIRQWRKHRGLTLQKLADRLEVMFGIKTTHTTISRIERRLQPYSQALLEGIADALQTDAGSLLMRDPTDPEGIWSVWDQAQHGQRKIIVELAKTVLKTGT